MVAVKLPDNPAPFIIAERCEMIKSDNEVEASRSMPVWSMDVHDYDHIHDIVHVSRIHASHFACH